MVDLNTYILSRINETKDLADAYTDQGRYDHRHIFVRLKKYAADFSIQDKAEARLVVLHGLRGIGKTTLIFQLYRYLLMEKNVSPMNVLYLSADHLASFAHSNIQQAVKAYIEGIHQSTLPRLRNKLFIFIDEVHFDKEWEIAIKSIFDQTHNVFILVSGSSSIALQMGTDISRRAFKEPLFPLNFAEYELLKNRIFPVSGMIQDIKQLILTGDTDIMKSLQQKEEQLHAKLKRKRLSPTTELERFLQYGGFTTSLNLSDTNIQRKVVDIIEKIVQSDLPQIHSFNTSTYQDIFRIIGQLAIKKPGETSHTKLANALGLSPTKVKEIFDALEKTHLIYPVKPYVTGGSKSWAKRPWKYYFLSPTLLCCLRSNMGYKVIDNEQGLLYETAVGSSLFRWSETTNSPVRILYDPGEHNVDFLISNPLTGSIIPVEVGINKTHIQTVAAMKKYESPYGIIITNMDKSEVTKVEGKNIFKIPLKTFVI